MEEEYSSTTESHHDPPPNNEIVTVSIDNYRIQDGHINKHVVYLISGQDHSGVFESARRYKEFKVLRTLLIMNWPICHIPKLPKKKAVGNLNKDLIHKRKKLLDYFIGKVVSQSYLYKSEAFQLFIRNPGDYIKSSKSINAVSYMQMSENLKKNLQVSESFQVSQNHIELVDNFYTTLEDNIRRVRNFKKVCKKNALSFYRYEDGLLNLSSSIGQVVQYFSHNKGNFQSLQKKSTNPYKIFLDWARREIVETEAFLESIEKKVYLEAVLAKCQAKLGKQQHDLESFQGGKKSLMQKLMKKNDEETIKQLESHVVDTEKEIQALQEIIKISMDRLVNFQIPQFRDKETEKLEGTIRCYSGVIVDEFSDFISYFTSVQDTIKPPTI